MISSPEAFCLWMKGCCTWVVTQKKEQITLGSYKKSFMRLTHHPTLTTVNGLLMRCKIWLIPCYKHYLYWLNFSRDCVNYIFTILSQGIITACLWSVDRLECRINAFVSTTVWPAIFLFKCIGIYPELRWYYHIGQFLAISAFLPGPWAC